MGMAHGVEVRVPFLDPDLVQFCASIPPKLKQKNNVSKYILKKVASQLIPKDIVYRSKSGFGAPLRLWMTTKPFQDMQHELLNKKSIEKRGLFDSKNTQSFIKNTKHLDTPYSIFSLMCIELWCRKFLDSAKIN
jgi:asparagine synthase (glutamine-hydrolysing)